MILVPIVEKYSSFTTTELKIADFILNNPQDFLDKTASQLASLTETSPAAIIRFSRKIGFDGYSDMKVGLAKFYYNTQYFDRDMIINENDSYKACGGKLLAQINDVCKATEQNINYEDLSKIVHKIDRAKTIYLLGVGSSGTAAENFQQKLLRLYKKVFYISDSQINFISMVTLTEDDVVIAFSYSGNTKIIEASIKAAKKQGAYAIAITGNSESPVGQCADKCILTPSIEIKKSAGEVASCYSQQFVLDLLFLCLITEHYSEAEKLNKETTKLIEDLT